MARDFNGSSQYLSNANALVTAVPFSMSAWFNADSYTLSNGIFVIGDTGTNNENMGLCCSSTGHVRAFSRNLGNESAAQSSTTASTGTWAHAAGVWSAANARAAYLNGGNKGTESTSRTPTAAALDNTWIARHVSNSLGLYFDGRVAEVALWNVALDDSEVAALGKGFCPLLIRPQSLVGYWPVLGNQSPEQDRWATKFDMTLQNSPTKADHPRIYYPTGVF